MYKIIACCIVFMLCSIAQGQVYNVTIPAIQQIQLSEFRLWIPENSPALRGVIIHCHGCGNNSINTSADLQWRALAKKWNMGLLGVHFTGDCNDWAFPEKGSYTALTTALANFATQSNRTELNTVPWVLWGHSGGGNWVYFMTELYANRIICSYTRTGSGYRPMSDEGLKVPFIIATGRDEVDHPIFGPDYNEARLAFGDMRSRGGLTAWSSEPNALHGCEQTRYMAIPFIDLSISKRLPPSGNTLLNIAENTGWLADTTTRIIAAYNSFTADKSKASWLINENEANSWKEFELSAKVTDISKPSAPFNVIGTKNGNTVTINWNAEADLQSGVQQFNIYKNGIKVSQLGDASNRFQWGDGSDNPNPENPKMEIILTNENVCGEYKISQVNTSGLESDLSAAYNSCVALPAAYIGISATCMANGEASIKWQTQNETNISDFIIELQTPGSNEWQTIGKKEPTNSAGIHLYEIQTPIKSTKTNLLRIKIVDKDGKITYSEVTPLTCNQKKELISLGPSPADQFLQINMHNPGSSPENYGICLLNTLGGKVAQYDRVNGNKQINVSSLANGIYVIIFHNAKGELLKREKIMIHH
jgi:hypothetical protein